MYDVRLNFIQIIPAKEQVTTYSPIFHRLKKYMGYQLLLMDIKSQDQWFEEEILRKWGSD